MSRKIDLDKTLKEIIEKKHRELGLGKDYTQQFSKIRDFEANAIGQIGEEFIKRILHGITEIDDTGIIHNEYDIVTKGGVRFEVKTAREGRANKTFQFNGINPNYNYNYLICLGICEDKMLYRMFLKSQINYIHKDRAHFIVQGGYKRKLVQMNPNNQVNYKLTINIRDLYDINHILEKLKEVLVN